ncbi:uncharacterized protein LOC129258590 [Lytechinus pictus]|uniref:uncharacterized protein LOC129258590 n=1 Tax=Lytechinus pictus TaxID=7653 RepID=UPI0030B9F903
MLHILGILLFVILDKTSGSEIHVCPDTKHCKIVHVEENVEYIFDFLVDQNSQDCTFSLKFNGAIFNNNGTFLYSDHFTALKHPRTHITAKTVFDYLIVTLEIRSIQVDDAGRYRAIFQCSNSTSTISQLYLLRVYHPPGSASCQWHEPGELNLTHVNYQHLPALQCSARNGYPESNIICYSRHHQAIIAHNPRYIAGDEIITSIFWLPRKFLRCCSVSELYRKSYRWCRDFVSTDSGQEHSTQKVLLSTKSLSQSTTVPVVRPKIPTGPLQPTLYITSTAHQLFVNENVFLWNQIVFVIWLSCIF